MSTTIAVIAIALIVLAVLIAAFLVVAAAKPDVFRVRRATIVQAPPEKIFPLLNDFQGFRRWSPYEHKDPAMKRTFSGPAAGKGAVYEWNGNNNVGAGRMEIADELPGSKVTLTLDMLKPLKAHNIVEFTLEPKGASTIVTWAMHGPVPYFGKILHTIFNMDRMVGRDFEGGLANLKAIAEA